MNFSDTIFEKPSGNYFKIIGVMFVGLPSEVPPACSLRGPLEICLWILSDISIEISSTTLLDFFVLELL